MTATVVNLDKERRIAANIKRLGELLSGNPEATDRTFQFLNGNLPTMAEKEAETVVISIRVSPTMNAKLLALAGRLSTVDSFQPGRTSQAVTKAAVIREALAIGVDSLTMVANGAELVRDVAQKN